MKMTITQSKSWDKNLSEFIEKLNTVAKINEVQAEIVRALANDLVMSMAIKIEAGKPEWIDKIGLNPNDIQITEITDDTATIECGSNTPPVEIRVKTRLDGSRVTPRRKQAPNIDKNGNVIKKYISEQVTWLQENKGGNVYTFDKVVDLVNPYFFIEYGFGLKGEANPSAGATEIGWAYNVNKHTAIEGQYNTPSPTYWKVEGAIGVEFIQNTILELSANFEKTINNILKNNGL